MQLDLDLAGDRFALVLFHPEGDSVLLTDWTWITFARLLSWHRRAAPVWLFVSPRSAQAVRRSWRGRPDIRVVPV